MKKRATAGLLAIFLGAFGAHHFYLNNKRKGFVYLLLCWTLVVPIIAMIEGIILLMLDLDTFDSRYNHDALVTQSTSIIPFNLSGELTELIRQKKEGLISAKEYESRKAQLLKDTVFYKN